MQVADFIEGFQKQEQDRIQRNDVLTRFQNKVQVQQIAALKSENQVEVLPITVPKHTRNRSEVVKHRAFNRSKSGIKRGLTNTLNDKNTDSAQMQSVMCPPGGIFGKNSSDSSADKQDAKIQKAKTIKTKGVKKSSQKAAKESSGPQTHRVKSTGSNSGDQ